MLFLLNMSIFQIFLLCSTSDELDISYLFLQNLAEAEYCVALFMYMRLIGYPANKITILTTYNGQKQMIREIIQRRCATNPLIGMPHKVFFRSFKPQADWKIYRGMLSWKIGRKIAIPLRLLRAFNMVLTPKIVFLWFCEKIHPTTYTTFYWSACDT